MPQTKTKQVQKKCVACKNKVELKQVESMQPVNLCNDCYKNMKDNMFILANRPKNVTKEEFDRYVKPCGSSGHVGVSKAWVGKWVHFTIEEIKEENG